MSDNVDPTQYMPAELQVMLAWYHIDAGKESNLQEAMRLFEQAASGGDASALYGLGMMYALGLGVQKDLYTAIKLLEKAAHLDYAPALYRLGIMCTRGEGIQKNLEKASIFFEHAAHHGSVQACFQLGLMSLHGRGGVKQDTEEAERRFKAAAEAKYVPALYMLAGLHRKKNDWTAAIHLYTDAANRGHAGSQYILACAYAHGKGVPKDVRRGIEFCRMAAHQGHKGAIQILVKMHQAKLGASGPVLGV